MWVGSARGVVMVVHLGLGSSYDLVTQAGDDLSSFQELLVLPKVVSYVGTL